MRFEDICLIAKDILKRHPQRVTEVNKEQVIYENGVEETTLLDDIASDLPIKKIYIDSIRANDKIWGMLLRYDTHADINVSSDLNHCWTRFVVAKELCHLLIDTTEKSFVVDLLKHISDLISSDHIEPDSHSLNSETWASILACELMMPFNHNAVLESQDSSYHIACRYGMPEKMIDLMRTEWYQSCRKDCYENIL